MRIRWSSWLALLLSSMALPALAQTQPANTVRTLLAAGHLGSVVDTPLHLRLFAVRLPAAERVSYSGPNSMLYVLSGKLMVALDGNAQTVSEGAGVFIPAGRAAVLDATGIDPTRFLQFVLEPAAEAQNSPLGVPARSEELYRTHEPLPGLRPDLTSSASRGSPCRRVCPPTLRIIARARLCTTLSRAPGLLRPMERSKQRSPERHSSNLMAGFTSGQFPATPRSSFFRRTSAKRAFR